MRTYACEFATSFVGHSKSTSFGWMEDQAKR